MRIGAAAAPGADTSAWRGAPPPAAPDVDTFLRLPARFLLLAALAFLAVMEAARASSGSSAFFFGAPLPPPAAADAGAGGRGASPSALRAAAAAWARGSWAPAPAAAPAMIPAEGGMLGGTPQAFHNFTRGCGPARERATPLSQRWRPAPSPRAPPFPAWSRAATCAALGGSPVVVLGDSLSGQFFDTLVAALAAPGGAAREHRCFTRTVCNGPGEVPAQAWYVEALTLVSDDFGGDFLTPYGEMDKGEPPCAAPPEGWGARISWQNLLTRFLDAPRARGSRAPVLVANHGAHFLPPAASVPAAVAMFEYARLVAPDALLFWRTAPAGHPGCAAHRNGPPLAAPLTEAELGADETAAGYAWHQFRNASRATIAALPDSVLVLDVDAATALRADSHPWRADMEAQGKVDCLHYCTPGPVDFWVELWAALLRMARGDIYLRGV